MDKIFRILMFCMALYLILRFSLTLIDSLDTLVVSLILLEFILLYAHPKIMNIIITQ